MPQIAAPIKAKALAAAAQFEIRLGTHGALD
jgi:hypothetical protein